MMQIISRGNFRSLLNVRAMLHMTNPMHTMSKKAIKVEKAQLLCLQESTNESLTMIMID